jgi:outer membrane protein assembly factor BamD
MAVMLNFTYHYREVDKSIMRKFSRIAAALLCLSLLNACANRHTTVKDDRSPAQMYADAEKSVKSGDYSTAVDRLNALQTRYPFGTYAQRAQLELVYVHYQMQQWEDALADADRFIRDYPRHPQLDYVLYMKGLVSYERSLGFLERTRLRISNASMDIGYTQSSFESFATLLRRFPESKYAPEAHQRMVFLRNRLAEHDLHAVDYYYRRGAYLAAINRGQDIVNRFQGTPAAYDALRIMSKSYSKLGMRELATQIQQILEATKAEFGKLPTTKLIGKG